MNILYLCSDHGIPVLGRKGASVHVRSLVAAFARAGHHVALAAPVLTRVPWEAPAAIDANVMHVPPAEGITSAVEQLRAFNTTVGDSNNVPGELRRILYNQQLEGYLLRRLAASPPDVIYERAALYGTAGLSLARTLQVPIVLELNAPLTLEQSTYRQSSLTALAAQAERHTLNGADLVLPVSSALQDYALGLGVPPERTRVVPNGIDSGLFTPAPRDAAVRQRWGLGEGPVLGFVGGLRQWHGVRVLPRLLGAIVRAYPSAQMVIVGEGPLRAELQLGFGALGLADRVVFTGAVAHEQVPALIREFDVALAPYEPPAHAFYFSPLKLFEYMGCGVPVVAAAIGQIPEVIRDRETGVLYPPGDAEELARACRWVLDDPSRGAHLGGSAAAHVHGRYTWDANARQVIEAVRGIAARLEACA